MNFNMLKIFIPSKKLVVIFIVFSIIMGIASLQANQFNEKESALYSILWPVVDPLWSVWLYLSWPVIYFTTGGFGPISSIRYFAPQPTEEIFYGLNFVYFYFLASIGSYFLNLRTKKPLHN